MASSGLVFPVPIIIKKIMKKQFSGTLTVQAMSVTRILWFKQGNLVFASSSQPVERFGEYLIIHNRIQPHHLVQALIIQKSSEFLKLGNIIINEGWLSEKDVNLELANMISHIATASLKMDSCNWKLDHQQMESNKINVPISLQSILKSALENPTILQHYQRRFSEHYVRIQEKSDGLEKEFQTGDRIFFDILKTQERNRASEIIQHLFFDEREFWQKCVFMYLLDVIDFIPKAEPKKNSIESSIGTSQSMKRDFKNSRQNSQTLKKVENDTQKIETEDNVSNFSAMKTDKKTIQNQDFMGKSKAADLYANAVYFYNNKKYKLASNYLDRSLRQNPNNGKHLWLLGMCDMMIPERKHRVEEVFLKVSELEPWNPNPFTSLGLMFLSESMLNRSKHYFEKAIKIDPTNQTALENINYIKRRLKSRSKSVVFEFLNNLRVD